jgi:acid phosphatase type 7
MTGVAGSTPADHGVSTAKSSAGVRMFVPAKPPRRRDRRPPSVPSRLTVTAVGQTSLSLAWKRSKDNVRVVRYRVYRNGTLAGRTSKTSYVFSGLRCRTRYELSVTALDAAGNSSRKASITRSTKKHCPPPPPPPPPPGGEHTIAAVGDFTSCQGTGCDSGNSKAVHDVIVGMNPEFLLGVGDFQYQYISTILNGWDRLYGPKPNGGLFPIVRPTAGPTHDVSSCTDNLYESYFGRSAMRPYSFDVGSWHIISLPTAAYRYGCDTDGVLAALNADLNANSQPCTLAFFQDPYWTRPTATHTRLSALRPWIQALYDHNAELVVQASNHDYQRFAPQNPSDGLDPARGIRAFVVGTGGIGLYPFTGTAPNVEASDATTWGALKLVLRSNGYDFQFVRAAGGSFTDAGSGTCH